MKSFDYFVSFFHINNSLIIVVVMFGIRDARNNLKTRKILGGFYNRVYPEYEG